MTSTPFTADADRSQARGDVVPIDSLTVTGTSTASALIGALATRSRTRAERDTLRGQAGLDTLAGGPGNDIVDDATFEIDESFSLDLDDLLGQLGFE